MRRKCHYSRPDPFINIAIVVATLLSAQADQVCSASSLNWGEPVCGIQMFIGFTNPVVKAGTSESLYLKIRNSSTNAISLNLATNLPPEMLTNNIGKKYELHEIKFDTFSDTFAEVTTYWKVQPGETREGCWSVFIGKDVQAGDYSLVTYPRDITIAGAKVCTLLSGVQTVHVK